MLGKARSIGGCAAALALGAGFLALGAGPAGAVSVSNEAQLRAAFLDVAETSVVLTADIDLTDCGAAHVLRPGGAAPLVVSGAFTIRQTCPNVRVIGSAASTGALTIEDATITGGRLTADPSATGGGIFWQGDVTLDGATVTDNTVTAPISALAGGVFASGALLVQGSVIADNSALSNGDFGGLGGATVANGETDIIDSVVSGNTAGGGVDFAGSGGAIFGNSDVTVLRSTFSGNTAGAAEGGDGGNGGAIVINASLSVVNSTIVDNVAEGAGSSTGGLGAGGDLQVLYSTVVGNSAASSANLQSLSTDPSFSVDEVFGSVIADPLGGGTNCGTGSDDASTGFNVSDDASCNLGGTGDQQDVADVGLGALGANGGPTPTMLPAAGSVVLDVIPPASCRTAAVGLLDTDQRGIARPQGTGCDVGAVEVFVQAPTTTTPTTTVPGTPPAAQPVPADPTFTG